MLTAVDVSAAGIAVSLCALAVTLYGNRGNLPLRRAETRVADANATGTEVDTLRKLLDTWRDEVQAANSRLERLQARVTTLEAAMRVFGRWVATLSPEAVPADVRQALTARAHDPLSGTGPEH